MMKKWFVAFAGLSLLAMLPVTAGEWWIVGISAGSAKMKDFRLATDSFEDKETVFMPMAGYQSFKYFGVVGGYLDLGEYHAEGPNFGGYSQDMKIKGIYARGLGILPVAKQLSLLGSVGMYRWKYDFDETGRHLSDTGYTPSIGLGVNVDLSGRSEHFRGLNLHAGWEG